MPVVVAGELGEDDAEESEITRRGFQSGRKRKIRGEERTPRTRVKGLDPGSVEMGGA